VETLVLIVAFWLILIGAYGVMTLRPRGGEPRAEAAPAPARSRAAASRRPAASQRPARPPTEDARPSEVDLLRAQVEHLRTEVLALSSTAPQPRIRRQRPAPEADLPRPLRRQVREARVRRPVHA